MIDVSKLHEGTVVFTEGNRKRVVDHYDGKNIRFKDGAVYSWRHPGLTAIAEEQEEVNIELPDEDMRGWTIAALKGYCAEHEIPCKGCRIKADYLSAIGLKPVVNRVAED